MRPIEGKCLCGRSSYRAEADVVQTFNCHCTDCQRQTGSPFASAISIADESFHAEGDIATFTHSGGSGATIARSFCRACGSPLFSTISARTGLVYIKVGSLNDTSWVEPEINIWCSSAQPWVAIDRTMPFSEYGFKFAQSPEPLPMPR